ncbi:Uncharacterized protein Adt_06306 [Abeliophyllum distichum]|uniref:Reverse transcriptase Ty1/copia-type domain-containing protein n=1 Tax=Abeliophyllum distichum TaxID=126358 RepID=A0ABD1V8R2_9LAMI
MRGYNPGQKAYKVYNLSNKQVQVSRDITFYENCFPFKSEINPITDKSSPVIPYPECYDDDPITIPSVSPCDDQHNEPFQNITTDSSSGETTADSSSTYHNSIPLVHVPFPESPENIMSETQALRQIKKYLHSQFTIKDIGAAKYFLGLEIARGKKGTYDNQRKYILDIIKDARLMGARSVLVPIPKGIKLSQDSSSPFPDPERYRRLIGRLLYLNLTRPDITYGIQQLSQFVYSPCQIHWDTVICYDI